MAKLESIAEGREIPLTNGQTAIVSPEDYEYLSAFKWGYMRVRHGDAYARRTTRDENGDQWLMHAVVARRMGLVCEEIDHRNRNKLDNRRGNLRASTKRYNRANTKIRKNNTTGYRGVVLKRPGKWTARIRSMYKTVHLGYFPGPELAAKAYDQAAIKEFGEFASLNFPTENPTCFPVSV